MPGFTVRLLPLDECPVEVDMRVKVSDISYQSIQVTRRFRRYVQVIEGAEPVFFKEFGDASATRKARRPRTEASHRRTR